MADLIHFVWLGDEMPPLYTENVETFKHMNPQATVEMHTGPGLLWAGWWDAWQQALSVAQQSDLLRLSVLRRCGGWYFDTDCRCVSQLPSIESLELGGKILMPTREEEAGKRPAPNNWAMACERGACTVWPLVDRGIIGDVAELVHADMAKCRSMANCYGGLVFGAIESATGQCVVASMPDVLYNYRRHDEPPRGCVKHPVKPDWTEEWNGNRRPPTTQED